MNGGLWRGILMRFLAMAGNGVGGQSVVPSGLEARGRGVPALKRRAGYCRAVPMGRGREWRRKCRMLRLTRGDFPPIVSGNSFVFGGTTRTPKEGSCGG
jgi:hypothetical protein